MNRNITCSSLKNLDRDGISFASHIQSFQLSGHSPVLLGPDKQGSTVYCEVNQLFKPFKKLIVKLSKSGHFIVIRHSHMVYQGSVQ